MGEVVKAHISPCPECGENEWWMVVDTGVELTPEDKLQRAIARRLIDEARDIRLNSGLFGFLNWRLRRRKFLRSPITYEDPSSPDHIRCGNCGHEMSLAQSGHEADPKHDWPIA